VLSWGRGRKHSLDEYPFFAGHIEQHITESSPDEVSEFEFGLDLILDGLEKVRDTARR
jgi:hypothetical protein